MNPSRTFLSIITAVCFLTPCFGVIEATLAIDVKGEFRPTIRASTTLPDGMKLLVRVTRKESAFASETPVEVQAGHFEVGPLQQSNADLNPGTYNVEILSLPLADQPEPVTKVLGKKGEELRGPLIKHYSGTTQVRLLTTFQVGQRANPELDQARRNQVGLSQTRWWRKNCTEICSGAERYAQQKSESFDRGACMKTCIANAPSGPH